MSSLKGPIKKNSVIYIPSISDTLSSIQKFPFATVLLIGRITFVGDRFVFEPKKLWIQARIAQLVAYRLSTREVPGFQ